jgi:DNA-binding response OmpR family regulator
MTPTNKLRILFAEDDPDNRELTCLILEADGFEVICPDNSSDFLRTAKRERFDVYMLDTWMPEISGLELCKILREFDADTPIVFYSAAAYEHDRNRAFACGAQAYIIKPARFEDLCKTLRALTNSSPAQFVASFDPGL